MIRNRITRADIVTFTRGDCHILAREMHGASGWPIYVLSERTFGTARHFFVMAPTGHAVDVEGVHTISGMKKQWVCEFIREMTVEKIRRLGWGEKAHAWATPRAEELAPHIIAEAQHSLGLAGIQAVPAIRDPMVASCLPS